MTLLGLMALVSAAIWIWLLAARGGFWRASEWLPARAAKRETWPEVAVVIPARDEADVIGESIASHMATRYPGAYSVILVDDDSSDATVEQALNAAEGRDRALHIVTAPPLRPGWTGKIAAQAAGLEAVRDHAPEATYILFTDADIVHGPGIAERLVARAEDEDRALVSLMARLDDRGLWGGLLVPAFVFFFQKLYPFPLVNDPASPVAGAAGGCMLVRRDHFERLGGFEPMRDALIDDCALARLIKGRTPRRSIWLGLSLDLVSRRDNRSIASIWKMVARSAFAQLDHSALRLAGTVIGMILVYLAGPWAFVSGLLDGAFWTGLIGLAAWVAMAVAYAPTLMLYERSVIGAFLLPVAGLLYTLMTLSSAVEHWRGTGGRWKGRTYSHLAGAKGAPE